MQPIFKHKIHQTYSKISKSIDDIPEIILQIASNFFSVIELDQLPLQKNRNSNNFSQLTITDFEE